MSDDLAEMTDCLKTAKDALEQNLIEGSDYDQVKAAFLRAQQIRAGLDAGFIRQDDYDQIKQTFLQSLQGMSVAPISSMHQSGPAVSDRNYQIEQQAAAAAPAASLAAPPPQASQNGRQTNKSPSFSQPPASTSHAPAPASAAPSGPVTSGGATIPADIPKMGGNRPKHLQGVSLLLAVHEAAYTAKHQANIATADINEWDCSPGRCCKSVLLHEGKISGMCELLLIMEIFYHWSPSTMCWLACAVPLGIVEIE